MSNVIWLKIGAVAALWTIIGGSALAGWWIGHGESARQLSELRQRLAVNLGPKDNCGIEVERLDLRDAKATAATSLFGMTLGGILPSAPRHLHLREMLTSR